jgi:hypothetical protein
MDNANDKRLSFPQRNWLLLCILVAILSPLVVHWVHGAAQKKVYDQAINPRPAGNDTSYKVASPPGGDSAKGAGGAAGATPGAATPGGASSDSPAAGKK